MLHLKKLTFALSFLTIATGVVLAEPATLQTSFSNQSIKLLKKASFLEHLNLEKTLEFSVWLKFRNPSGMRQMLNDIYNPKSPLYHHYLSKADIEQTYAPTQEMKEKVKNYFVAQGMQAKVTPFGVKVSATVKQIEHTFKTKINQYRFQKRLVYANDSALSLNHEIAPLVSDITGLNNLTRGEPTYALPFEKPTKQLHSKPHDLNFIWKDFKPSVQPTTTSIGGLTGSQLRTALNVANVPSVSGQTIDGTDQTIVLFLWCDSNYNKKKMLSDANKFSIDNGLPVLTDGVNFKVVNTDGTPYTTCTGSAISSGMEIALDIQAAHLVAPKAKIVYVLTQTNSGADLVNGLFFLTDQLALNHSIGGFSNANVVSNSLIFFAPEVYFPPLEDTFLVAALSGLSYNFSSGDNGDNKEILGSAEPTVYYPSSSTYVTSIGGTSLFVDNSYQYAFETGWGTTLADTSTFFFGAGGGMSIFYPAGHWQNDISTFTAGGYGVISDYNTCGDEGVQQCRAVPDIGMLADPATGLLIFYQGEQLQIAGTSLACPLFTAALALVNQERALLAHSLLGLAAPYLYFFNDTLLTQKALNLVIPPHQIVSGATEAPQGAPLSSFTLDVEYQGLIYPVVFSWDSSLTIEPEAQFWNDVVGVGSPNLAIFVPELANL